VHGHVGEAGTEQLAAIEPDPGQLASGPAERAKLTPGELDRADVQPGHGGPLRAQGAEPALPPGTAGQVHLAQAARYHC
jgi:hypothetical protein